MDAADSAAQVHGVVSMHCSVGNARGIEEFLATIHAAPLEYADMSSVSRWAASVRSVTSDQGTEAAIGTCAVMLFKGSLKSRLLRVIQRLLSCSG